jgi:hypothetical protein
VYFSCAFQAFWTHAPSARASDFEENMLFDFHGIEYDSSKLEPIYDIFFHERGVVYGVGNWKTTNHSLTPPFSFDIHNTNSQRTLFA